MPNAIARASGQTGAEGRERIVIPEPWDDFRGQVADVIRAVTVSHRPDHGPAGHGTGATVGKLYNETAYGLTGETDARASALVVHRVPLETFDKADDLRAIRDPDLRRELIAFTQGHERGAPVLLCGRDHHPTAVCLPLDGHHARNGRVRAQWEARPPLFRQLWRSLVVAKVRWQGAVLAANGHSAEPLEFLARRVGSGDPDNVEAQAARRYWVQLMGADFRRDREAGGTNAMLNYGYAVLRALCARSVVAAGLHPSIGIHHAHRGNAFALADDLIEPFRPLVDQLTVRLRAAGVGEVTPEAKRAYAALIAVDLPGEGGVTSVANAATRAGPTLARSFQTGRAADLVLPRPPSPIGPAALDLPVPR